MRVIIKHLFADKIVGWSISISIGLLFINVLSVLVAYRFLPPYIPLYNNLSWGYARIGHTYALFFPLLLVIFFLGINSYIGIHVQQKAPLLSRFLFITTLSLSIFTTIFLFKLFTIIL